jgi:hypothetical protein
MQLDELEKTVDRWLGSPAVALAETALAREFHANWGQPNGSLDHWDEEVTKHVTLLPQAAA